MRLLQQPNNTWRVQINKTPHYFLGSHQPEQKPRHSCCRMVFKNKSQAAAAASSHPSLLPGPLSQRRDLSGVSGVGTSHGRGAETHCLLGSDSNSWCGKSWTPLDKFGKEKRKQRVLFISNWFGFVASCEHIKQRFYVQIWKTGVFPSHSGAQRPTYSLEKSQLVKTIRSSLSQRIKSLSHHLTMHFRWLKVE